MTQKTFEELAITNRRQDHLYFTMIPNVLWFFDLTPADFKLYNTIVKTTGCDGQTQCFKSTKTLAKETGLSMGSISKAKAKLEEAGLIERYSKKRSKGGRPVDHLVLVDIWKENMLFFSEVYSSSEETLIFASLSELRERVFSRNEGVYSPNETEEEPFNKNQKKREKEEEETSFEDLEAHPSSIQNTPEAPISIGYKPSVADPNQDPPEVEELARQLAPPIDWVWDYDERTNKALLHAARDLFVRCKDGGIDDVLDALDAYLGKNSEWAREHVDSPMGLVTLVGRQFQKMQARKDRQAVARVASSTHANLSLAYREAIPEPTAEEQRWGYASDVLRGGMDHGTFLHLFAGADLISLAPPVLEVRDEGVKEMLELRWAERVAEALDVESVAFEVANDAKPRTGEWKAAGGL